MFGFEIFPPAPLTFTLLLVCFNTTISSPVYSVLLTITQNKCGLSVLWLNLLYMEMETAACVKKKGSFGVTFQTYRSEMLKE